MVCPHCGAEFEPAGKRSSQANRYLFGVVYKTIANETGFTVDEVHDAMKVKFRSREDVSTGLTVVRSTRSDTDDFWEYVDQVRLWSHTFLGAYIPEPNEETSWIKPANDPRA